MQSSRAAVPSERGKSARTATGARVRLLSILTTLTLALCTAPALTWAGGIVTPCDDAHLSAALVGGGAVTFSCGGPATITVLSAKTISANTTVDGGGTVTLSGNNLVQVFIVNSGTTFAVQNLTIASGKGSGFAGGITNNGTTTVTNCTFSDNTGDDGGAIYNATNLTVSGSTFNANSATVGGGGIYNAGTMNVTASSFNGNTGLGTANGGAIANFDIASVTSSLISGNAAGPTAGNGGGIYDDDSLTLTDSTVRGNSTAGGGNGGGFYANGTNTVITSSTLSGNTAGSGSGGGLYANGITTTVTNSTLSFNTAAAGGGAFNNGDNLIVLNATIASNTGGGIANNGISTTLTNTIIANNGVACVNTGISIVNGGTNLQFPGTTCPGIPSADPLLQTLANNGGPTFTQALSAGSPAIDAGTTGCPPTPATDQRGVPRPQGAACDIGAFEFQSGVTSPPTIAKAFGGASLPLNASTSLSFTLTNPNAAASLTGIGFTDTLPSGLVVASPNGLAGSCGGGTITAVAGSGSVSLAGATLAASTSCNFSVNVTGTSAGAKNNTTAAVTSNEGGTGGTASASITVVTIGPPPPPGPTNIPTLEERSLWLLGLTLLVAGGVALRRRRRE
jgi:MYXO-CTERM domain-containing protein